MARIFSSIVVGTDGSESADRAVRKATELAKLSGAPLHVVAAYRAPQQRERLQSTGRRATVELREVAEAVVERVAERSGAEGVEVDTHAREADPAGAIIDVAEETAADLIVVGNKGMSGAARFLMGSVPDKVSHHAPASVLIVRTT